MGRSRLVIVAISALVAVTALAGCVQSSAAPRPTGPSVSTPSSTPTPTVDPTFAPGGSAQDNRGYFDFVNTRLFTSNGSANGRAIVDNLVSAGFDKASMQVTPDKTSINGGADSILFSVKIGSSCLLGQHGGGGYSSAVEVALANGNCLVGKTRTIDW